MWALHNSLKGWTLYSLTDREVQLLVNTMTINEIKLVKVCKENDNKWSGLTRESHPQLFAALPKNPGGFPEPSLEASESTNSDTDYFVIRPKKSFHPRLHERIEKEFNAVILGQSDNFETTTIDLSEGGIHFNDLIPSWVSGYFIVRIYNVDENSGQKEQYSVMCSLVEDQKEKKRVQVMSEDSDPQFLRYKNWLDKLRNAGSFI